MGLLCDWAQVGLPADAKLELGVPALGLLIADVQDGWHFWVMMT